MARASKLLIDAAMIVDGARQSEYGKPQESFEKLAALWSAYTNIDISPHDACVMMSLLKVSRLAYKPDEDSSMDGAAYLALASEAIGVWKATGKFREVSRIVVSLHWCRYITARCLCDDEPFKSFETGLQTR